MAGFHPGKVKFNCIDKKIGYWPVLLYGPNFETPMQFRGKPECRFHRRDQKQLPCHLATSMAVWQGPQ
jgi:hypothetical protein